MSPFRWSNSSLTTLQACGERFRRRYIEKEWTPPSPRMLRGTVVHRIASMALYQKMTTADLPSREEVEDEAATAFNAEWRGGVSLNDEESAAGIRSVRDASLDFAVDLSAYHVTTVAPLIRPIAVERKIVVTPKHSDVVINGTIDLIDQPGPGREIIRDLKTSEKSPQADAADKSQQLAFYSVLRLAEVGTLPEKLILDHLVRTPVRAEKKHIVQETVRTQDDVSAVVRRITSAVDAVKKGIFMPAPSDAWFCAKQWCEFWSTCPYVIRGKRPTS